MNLRTLIGAGCLVTAATASLACADASSVAAIDESSNAAPLDADAGRPEAVRTPRSAPSGANDTAALGAPGLELSDARAERLAGRYVSATDAKVGLSFSSTKVDGKVVLSLRDLRGHELVHIEGSKSEGVVMRHGELTLRLGAAQMQGALSADRSLPEGDVGIEGNAATMADFERRPELALLPDLSNALGSLGLTGSKLPAALPLHAFAMAFASSSPAMKLGSTGSKGSAESSSSAAPLLFCTPGDVECCQQHPNDPGCIPDPDPPPPTDRCEGRQPGPGCHGMCGRGCDCWPNVCGDCCYHPGCAIHDNWCRRCDWLHPHSCMLCYSPAALIGVLGC
jgi:hypothetical protein